MRANCSPCVTGLFFACFCSFVLLDSKCEAQVKATPGEDVVLPCQAPRETSIGLMEWTRRDLKSGGYVFFYRDGNSHNSFQHPSFHGRVKLRDSEMKDGDVSVILKNVTINDTGTYECWIIVGHSGSSEPAAPRLMNNTDLTVVDSGHTPENLTDGKNTHGRYGLIGLVIGVITAAIGMLLKRKCCSFSSDKGQPKIPQPKLIPGDPSGFTI